MNRGMLGALGLALLTAGCAETGTSGDFGRVLGEVLGSATAPDRFRSGGASACCKLSRAAREKVLASLMKLAAALACITRRNCAWAGLVAPCAT